MPLAHVAGVARSEGRDTVEPSVRSSSLLPALAARTSDWESDGRSCLLPRGDGSAAGCRAVSSRRGSRRAQCSKQARAFVLQAIAEADLPRTKAVVVEIDRRRIPFEGGMRFRALRPDEAYPAFDYLDPQGHWIHFRPWVVVADARELPREWSSRVCWGRFDNVFGERFETLNPSDPTQPAEFKPIHRQPISTAQRDRPNSALALPGPTSTAVVRPGSGCRPAASSGGLKRSPRGWPLPAGVENGRSVAAFDSRATLRYIRLATRAPQH